MTSPPVGTLIDLREQPSWRRTKNALATGLLGLSVVIVAIPLVLVISSLVSKGSSIAFADFPHFFTDKIPIQARKHGPGMGPAIVGTLLVTGGATLIAVPLGVLGAIYLNEYGRTSRFARAVRFMSMVMTGVPSVVMGLFVYIVWTMNFGYSAFGGALALSFLMLPVVIGSTEQMLRLVPNHLREGAFALGARKSRVILGVVLPAAAPGVVSGCLLAIARAAGETAPLLFTIGFVKDTNWHLFSSANTALPDQIFRNVSSTALESAHERAWGAALTLVMLTFLLTLIARLVTARFGVKR